MTVRESGEMYLEAILVLAKKAGMSAPLTSANIWGIPSPAFPARWAFSGRAGISSWKKDGAITLTDSGKKLAETIYERHTVLSGC